MFNIYKRTKCKNDKPNAFLGNYGWNQLSTTSRDFRKILVLAKKPVTFGQSQAIGQVNHFSNEQGNQKLPHEKNYSRHTTHLKDVLFFYSVVDYWLSNNLTFIH